MKNIVLIGMPGCGKTTFGKKLAKALGRKFWDADGVLVEREKRSIKSFFAESENAFREAETRTLKYLAGMSGAVIATGGGAVLREENMACFSANADVIFLDRSPKIIIDSIVDDSRPLLAADKENIYKLYEERISLYRKYADVIVDNNGSSSDTYEELVCQWDRLRDEE